MLVEMKRPDTQDFVRLLIDVNCAGVGAESEAVKSEALDNRCPLCVLAHACSSPCSRLIESGFPRLIHGLNAACPQIFAFDYPRGTLTFGALGTEGTLGVFGTLGTEGAPAAPGTFGIEGALGAPGTGGAPTAAVALAPHLGHASRFGSTIAPHFGHLTGP